MSPILEVNRCPQLPLFSTCFANSFLGFSANTLTVAGELVFGPPQKSLKKHFRRHWVPIFLDCASSSFRQRLQQLGQERTDPGVTGFLGLMEWEKSNEPAVGLPRQLRPPVPDATSQNLGLVRFKPFRYR